MGVCALLVGRAGSQSGATLLIVGGAVMMLSSLALACVAFARGRQLGAGHYEAINGRLAAAVAFGCVVACAFSVGALLV